MGLYVGGGGIANVLERSIVQDAMHREMRGVELQLNA